MSTPDHDAKPTGPAVAISVAPLSLPGVRDAEMRLTVTNGDTPPATVWSRVVTSSTFGDGTGSISYVGPCDASSNDNVVTLEVLALYAAPDQTSPIPPASWRNPGPIARPFTCRANQDVAVDFDLTIARDAQQGFFDVAVSFEDVFCSAKLDCGDTLAPADDLLLLHDGDQGRATTVVLGFACTGDPAADADGTHLYLDPVRVDCPGSPDHVVIAPEPRGTVDLGAAPNVNTGGYLFGAAVYRGVEQLANKAYWNVALGLDLANAPGGTCTLRAAGTASGTALDGLRPPADTLYPVIRWTVPLTVDGARACTRHAIDAGAEVRTDYALPGANVAFAYHYDADADTVDSGCPAGTVSDGSGCVDADECAVAGACAPQAACTNESPGYTCTCPVGMVGDAAVACTLPTSCADLQLQRPGTDSGFYVIDPDGSGDVEPFEVECDLETAGGYWTRLVKNAPASSNPVWQDPGGYQTARDASHISPAWHTFTAFDHFMDTLPAAGADAIGGDISECGAGQTMAQKVAAPTWSCFPGQADQLTLRQELMFNVVAAHDGCNDLRANLAYRWQTWDAGISGAWVGLATNGYKTNNTSNCGTQCVKFSESCLADTYHGGLGSLWVR